MSDIAVRDYSEAAVLKGHGRNYTVALGEKKLELIRGTDFAVIPGCKQPSLLKSGCERLVMSAGLTQRFEVESAIEDYQTPFFLYRVKCDLMAHIDGEDRLITSGYGAANTNEKNNGRSSAFDSMNRTLKMARKRALSDACLTCFQLSSAFSQDAETLENTGALEQKMDVVRESDPISAKQLKRLFTIAGKQGVSVERANEIIKSYGYDSSKAITNKDYDTIIEKIQEAGN